MLTFSPPLHQRSKIDLGNDHHAIKLALSRNLISIFLRSGKWFLSKIFSLFENLIIASTII